MLFATNSECDLLQIKDDEDETKLVFDNLIDFETVVSNDNDKGYYKNVNYQKP